MLRFPDRGGQAARRTANSAPAGERRWNFCYFNVLSSIIKQAAAPVAAAPHTNRMVVPGRAKPSRTLPRVGGVGKPGFPTPLRTGCARTFPGAWVRGPLARIRKARGKPGFPPRSLPPLGGGARFPPPAGAGEGGGGLRRRDFPSRTLPRAGAWVRGPPARIRKGRGKPGCPPPSLPPLGGGARFPPPAGAGEGGGGLRRRDFPSRTLPRAGGYGETRFPYTPA